jgi:hypothetical protein
VRAVVIHAGRELQVKAEEREMAFMQKLGIDPSRGRITIAPREN